LELLLNPEEIAEEALIVLLELLVRAGMAAPAAKT